MRQLLNSEKDSQCGAESRRSAPRKAYLFCAGYQRRRGGPSPPNTGNPESPNPSGSDLDGIKSVGISCLRNICISAGGDSLVLVSVLDNYAANRKWRCL